MDDNYGVAFDLLKNTYWNDPRFKKATELILEKWGQALVEVFGTNWTGDVEPMEQHNWELEIYVRTLTFFIGNHPEVTTSWERINEILDNQHTQKDK